MHLLILFSCLSLFFIYLFIYTGELTADTALFNTEAVEYFQLKQEVLTGSLLGNYLASTNEALSIVAGKSAIPLCTADSILNDLKWLYIVHYVFCTRYRS